MKPLSVRLQRLAANESALARMNYREDFSLLVALSYYRQQHAATLYEAARNEATRERFNARVERVFADLESGLR